MDMKLVANITFWAALIVAAAALFGSPAGLLAGYWYWWPTETKAQVINALAVFGFGAIGVAGWAAINKPDRNAIGAALALVAVIAAGLGSATIDCTYLFRCP